MFSSLVFGLFAIAIGLAITYRGLSMFKVLLPIWAFFIGLWAGAAGVAALFGGSLFSSVLGLVVGFFVGLGFAAVSYFAFGLAVIIFGMSLGYSLGQGFMGLFGMSDGFLAFIIGLVIAVVFGLAFMTLRMPRFVVVFLTSLAGSMAVIAGTFVLFGVLDMPVVSLGATRLVVTNSAFWTMMWLLLAGTGFFAQYANEKKKEAWMKEFLIEDYIEVPVSK